MIKIAFSTRDEKLTDMLEKAFKEADIPFSITYFASSYKLLNDINDGYQIVFIDMDQKSYNAISLAKEIRTNNFETIIILTSSLPKHIVEEYQNVAFDYLLKPYDVQLFKEKLPKILDMVSLVKRKSIKIDTADDARFVSTDDIFFVQCKKDSIIYYTKLDAFTVKDVLSISQRQKLLEYGFLYCSETCLVNISKIDKIEKNNCFILNHVLKIDMKHKKDFEESFARYKEQKKNKYLL